MLILQERLKKLLSAHTQTLKSGLWLTFFGAILLAWWVIYYMSTQMGLNWYGAHVVAMDVVVMASMNSIGVLTPMWAIMMVVMMGPTFVVTMKTYEDLIASTNGTRIGLLGLILGYFVAWICFAAILATVQTQFMAWGWLDMMGKSILLWPSAFLLIAAGVFQFTWVKEACQGVCHAPMT